MTKVSIIIPVYNAAKYIAECLDSICEQTYQEIEIILVNDGSTDESLEICKQYAAKNQKIKIVNQNNRGCSAARNKGVQVAVGEYFMFVDADDRLTPDVVKDLVDSATYSCADVTIGTVNRKTFPTREYYNTDSEKAIKLCLNQRKYMQIYDMPSFLYDINPGSPWMKLIKRDIYAGEDILFPEDIRLHHEDTLFCIKLYERARTITFVDSSPYIYRVGVEDSLCNKFFEKKIEESIILLAYMEKYIEDTTYAKDDKESLLIDFTVEIILECWADYFTHKKNNLAYQERKNSMRKLLNDESVRKSLQKINCRNVRVHQRVVLVCMKRKWLTLLLLLANMQKKIKSTS